MTKIQPVKPFSIQQYADRNKLKTLGSVDIEDGSKVHFLTKPHQVQCLHLNKEGQVVGWKAAGGAVDNLMSFMVGIIKNIKKG